MLRKKLNNLPKTIISLIGSRYFFWFVIALFVFQALWIALSFRYSMIYDEYYHFGLIEYFSHQWLPWINDQPVGLDIYGSLERNPFLLYHYLLSFPYRIITLFTDNLAVQVVLMRTINIALFTVGLYVYDALFKKISISPVIRNLSLLFFVILPVAPFVAATINYDNEIFVLVAALLLVSTKIVYSKSIDWIYYCLFIIVGMLGSLSKNTFIPIFTISAFLLAINQALKYRFGLLQNLKKSFKKAKMLWKLPIILLIILLGIFFIERFGVNLVKYHSLSPSCSTVMNHDRCMSNYVELRNYELSHNKSGSTSQIPQFSLTWLSMMEHGLVVTGSNTNGRFGTEMGAPLPVFSTIVFLGFIIISISLAYSYRELKKIKGFLILSSTAVFYIATLFIVNMNDYYTYYQPLAIQGRYLIIILPLVMLFGFVAINNMIKVRLSIKLTIVFIVLILSINGAGITTHLVRGNDKWYWNNLVIRAINQKAKDVLNGFIIK